MQTEGKGVQLDGWRRIYTSGEIYWEWYDCGQFVIKCTLSTRDRILEKSGLPLKIIDSEIVGILTDF